MVLVPLSKHGNIYKCLGCVRAYDAFDGYYDLVDGKPKPDPSTPQSRCLKHEHVMCLAALQFKGAESVRTWRCPLAGCKEERITIGENSAQTGFSLSPLPDTQHNS